MQSGLSANLALERSDSEKALESAWRPPARRKPFLKLIDVTEDTLEIGPFCDPVVRGDKVSYFDVLDTDALRERAFAIGKNPATTPEIDYVSQDGDLTIVDAKFASVVSAHCIEDQPDLVRHLNQIADLLRPGGAYYLIVPDKRYCFDHFLPDTHIGDILQAHEERRTRHTLASVIEHRALTTHNKSYLHWIGYHGQQRNRQTLRSAVAAATSEFHEAKGSYIDVHAWKFTPQTLAKCVFALHDLGLTRLRPRQVWKTPFAKIEFTAVLERTE